MAVIEHDIAITSKDASGNDIIYYPLTNIGNVDGAIATINGIGPDAQGNVTIGLPIIDAVGDVRTRSTGKYNYGKS